jgi:hypothetical protein
MYLFRLLDILFNVQRITLHVMLTDDVNYATRFDTLCSTQYKEPSRFTQSVQSSRARVGRHSISTLQQSFAEIVSWPSL